MAFEIRNSSDKIVASDFENFDAAKTEAERLCSAADRQQQFTVFLIDPVWKTETRTLSDRPGFPVSPATIHQNALAEDDRYLMREHTVPPPFR